MKALQWDGRSISLNDILLDGIPNDQVRIKMSYAGLCGTDISIISNRYYNPSIIPNNIILGHEGVGRIIEIGCNVDEKLIGKVVAFNSSLVCNSCKYCLENRNNLCLNWRHIGITVDGTFAQYLTIEASQLHIIPSDFENPYHALVEPLAVVINCIEKAKPKIDSRILIVGPGVIGALLSVVLQEKGFDNVDICGLRRDQNKLKIIAEISRARIKFDKPNETYDFVFEVAGTQGALDTAIESVEPGGRIHLAGLDPNACLNATSIIRKEIGLSSSKGATCIHFKESINFIEKNSDKLSRLITNVDIRENYGKAIELAKSNNFIKIVIDLRNL